MPCIDGRLANATTPMIHVWLKGVERWDSLTIELTTLLCLECIENTLHCCVQAQLPDLVAIVWLTLHLCN